jgi:hypothetical protein
VIIRGERLLLTDKIVQIVAASPNWWARYPDQDGDFECPVALWALVEDEKGNRSIRGVDPTDGVWQGDVIGVDLEVEFVYRPDGPPGPQLWTRSEPDHPASNPASS